MPRPPDPDRFESARLRIRKGTLARTRGLESDAEFGPLEPEEILAAEDTCEPAGEAPIRDRDRPDSA